MCLTWNRCLGIWFFYLHENHGWGPPSREWRPDVIHCISPRMGAVLIEVVVIKKQLGMYANLVLSSGL